MIINRQTGISGAARASGPTIVIDVFRAFSAAAYAFAAGATRIILATEIDEAMALASEIANTITMGEVNGVRPDQFDLGNSPGEIVANPEAVSGRTVVHRSSAGTQCARAALDAGAQPVFLASLVVASATARTLATADEVTIVASGIQGVAAAAEDLICGDLIEELLLHGRADVAAAGERIANHDRAEGLRRATFTHPDDVDLATHVDRFGFVMKAQEIDGHVVVTAV